MSQGTIADHLIEPADQRALNTMSIDPPGNLEIKL